MKGKVQLKCREGGHKPVTLTELDPETAEPQHAAMFRWKSKGEGRSSGHIPHPEYNAERNADDTAWVVTCSTGKGCGRVYEVTDAELVEAVRLAGDRKPLHVYLPHEVGTRVE